MGKKEANWCCDIFVEHTCWSQQVVSPFNTLHTGKFTRIKNKQHPRQKTKKQKKHPKPNKTKQKRENT